MPSAAELRTAHSDDSKLSGLRSNSTDSVMFSDGSDALWAEDPAEIHHTLVTRSPTYPFPLLLVTTLTLNIWQPPTTRGPHPNKIKTADTSTEDHAMLNRHPLTLIDFAPPCGQPHPSR